MSDSYLINALIFLLSTLITFCTYILICRFILQLFDVDFFNPVSQAIRRITDPPLGPIRRLLPTTRRYDLAAFSLAFCFQFLYVLLIAFIFRHNINLLGTAFVALANTLNKMLNFLTFSVLGYVVISWLSHGAYNPLLEVIRSISLPLLARAQKFFPPIGGLDFTPMLVIILLQLAVMLIIIPLRDLGSFSF